MTIEKMPKERIRTNATSMRPDRVPYGRWASLVAQTAQDKREAEARAAEESRKKWEKK